MLNYETFTFPIDKPSNEAGFAWVGISDYDEVYFNLVFWHINLCLSEEIRIDQVKNTLIWTNKKSGLGGQFLHQPVHWIVEPCSRGSWGFVDGPVSIFQFGKG